LKKLKPRYHRFRSLRQLYRAIPEFKCAEGCTDCCCGTIIFSEAEEQVLAEKGLLRPRTVGDLCPYVEHGRCAIYEYRPFICRIFGATENAQYACFRGLGAKKKLDLAETWDLITAYFLITALAGKHLGTLRHPLELEREELTSAFAPGGANGIRSRARARPSE
jgi:hypothetical protein